VANHILLNNVDHKDLKINTVRSKALGDNVMSCIAYPGEFRDLQVHYPIVFARNPDRDETCAMALMGLVRGENLFLSENGWDATYVPMAMEMQPFLIGFSDGQDSPKQAVIHIDMDSPRVGEIGEPVFLPMGGTTPYLEHITGVLNRVHAGYEQNSDFFEALEKYGLLEPFSIDIELADGSSNRLAGFDTINEDKLYALGGEALAELNVKQYLLPIFMAVASLSHFADLVERKNAKVVSGASGHA